MLQPTQPADPAVLQRPDIELAVPRPATERVKEEEEQFRTPATYDEAYADLATPKHVGSNDQNLAHL